MKRIFLIAVILLVMTEVFTQEYPYYNPMYPGIYNPMRINAGFNQYTPPIDNDKKMDVGVQLGTSFATNFNKGFAFNILIGDICFNSCW